MEEVEIYYSESGQPCVTLPWVKERILQLYYALDGLERQAAEPQPAPVPQQPRPLPRPIQRPQVRPVPADDLPPPPPPPYAEEEPYEPELPEPLANPAPRPRAPAKPADESRSLFE